MNKIIQSIGTQTLGLASVTQVYCGSDMSQVALPRLGTMVAPVWDMVCEAPVFEGPSLVQQQDVNVEEAQLQFGLIGLLNFDLSPDEPAEDDMERSLEYNRSAE